MSRRRKGNEDDEVMPVLNVYRLSSHRMIMSCHAYAIRSSSMSCIIAAVMKSLLGLDLTVSLDGDLVVGLECGDGVAGDVGAWKCQQKYL